MREVEIALEPGRKLDENVLGRKLLAMGLMDRGDSLVLCWPTEANSSGLVVAPRSVLCVPVRRSLDARGVPLYIYRVEVYFSGETWRPYSTPQYKDVSHSEEVIIVGAGPAGMFAALKLLEFGFRPIILERGKDVHARKRDMAALSVSGVLDIDSNYCYGEGGAGAFSDGKLFTRSSKRGDNREVLYALLHFGADSSVVLDAHPHIGSDKLPGIVENIRHCITSHGGEYHFRSHVDAISRLPDGTLEVKVNSASDNAAVYRSRSVILATGHSARDVYEMLIARDCHLEAKGFALGVRVEHPQSVIDKARYHKSRQGTLPPAEYSFVQQVDGRGVFSFCMCPGGILVPSSTEADTVVLNGMSNSSRSSRWANAGVVVSIEPEDVPEKFASSGAFAALDYQREIERSMYKAARVAGAVHPFAAPGQRMMDFCNGKISANLPDTSYRPGVVSVPLHSILPRSVARRLMKTFPLVDKRIPGYYTNDALLLGVESRTSSPIRIPRDPQTLQSHDIPGLYPCGEGAGYSGGIVSSAIDGIRCATAAAAWLSDVKSNSE